MDYFGINTPEDLPRIKEVLADQVVAATNVKDAIEEMKEEEDNDETENQEPLAVSDDGELVTTNNDEEEN
jgi:segregation and condensation protein B